MRLADYWLAQALLGLWVLVVTLLYYGYSVILLADSILSRFAAR